MLGYYLISAFYVILNPLINNDALNNVLNFLTSTLGSSENTVVGIFGEGPTNQNAVIVMLGSAMTLNKFFPIAEALTAMFVLGSIQVLAFAVNLVKFIARMIPTVNVK